MTAITSPSPTVRQLSSPEGDGWHLAVLTKRTYRVLTSGDCVPDVEQLPLADDLLFSPVDKNLLEQDIDLIPRKLRTDVILKGHAYAGTPTRAIDARVQIGKHHKELVVIGRRRLMLSASGGLVIPAAEPFEVMPLSFANAYGGRDRAAEAKYGNPLLALAPYLEATGLDADNQSPYLYPRNPCGKGYLIEPTRAAVELCELPNLEDPRDMLDPARLVVGEHERWASMPIPQGLGWTNWGWFPRAAFGGFSQELKGDALSIPEIARRLMPKEALERPERSKPSELVYRFGQGAPLDMQLPFLGGDETVELTHLHPKVKPWRFRLPGRPTRIAADGRGGKLITTTPVLQTVVIEPDQDRVSVVWRGSASAKRPYFPHELAEMPLLVEW